MDEKPKNMKPPEVMPEFSGMAFSGMAAPTPVTIVPCPDCEGKNEPNTSGDYFKKDAAQSTSAVKIKSSELKKLKKFIHDEEVAVAAAKAASRKRDLFCVDLEREYGLNGMMWTADLEKGIIKITGPRKAPGE